MTLTENEKKIIEIIRELRPFEKIELSKDKLGYLDSYFIHRTQKVSLTSEAKSAIIVSTI